MSSLQGKRILVTGATSGIGAAIARRAAAEGARLALCGLGPLDQETRAAAEGAYFESFDLSDLEVTRAFAQRAIAQLGGLDGLVNTAGANFFRGVAGASYEDLARCFAVNFYPAWALCQECHATLRESRGVILNLASIHAERTAKGAFPYNASKAAVVALTKSLALEWGAEGIRALALAPALILSPLAEEFLKEFPDPAAARARLESHYPRGRAGQPEEVASLAAALLGDASAFLNGNTILVDGGISAQIEPDT